jgi:hypothetical protein
MAHRKLGRLVGTAVLVAAVGLGTAAVAVANPHVAIDAGIGGGAAQVGAPAWTDLMRALESCAAAGAACTVTVANGGQTLVWTAGGPILAMAGAGACEASEPVRAHGGGHAGDAVRGSAPQQLTP